MRLEHYVERHKAFMKQMPCLVHVIGMDEKIKFIDSSSAELMGYQDAECAIDTDYSQMKCAAAEDSGIYFQQDRKVTKRADGIKILAHFEVSCGWLLALVNKRILLDENGQTMGILTTINNLDGYKFIDVSRFLLESNRKFGGIARKSFYYDVGSGEPTEKYTLTNREQEVLFLLLRGSTGRLISEILHISIRTVQGHLESLKLKLSCSSKAELIEKALAEGFLSVIPEGLFKSTFAV